VRSLRDDQVATLGERLDRLARDRLVYTPGDDEGL
jgi:hypothetical protein